MCCLFHVGYFINPIIQFILGDVREGGGGGRGCSLKQIQEADTVPRVSNLYCSYVLMFPSP